MLEQGQGAAPSAVPTEVVAPSVAVETPPVVVEPVAPAPPPSLVAAEVPGTPEATATPEAPAEVPAAAVPEVAAEPPPAAEAPIDAAPPEQPVAYEAFTWPEGINPPAQDDPGLASFVDLGGEHNLPQDVMQKFADLHASEIQRMHEKVQQDLVQRQYDVFADTIKGWQRDFNEAPEFKNRTATVLSDANWAVRELSGTDEAAQSAFKALELSGMGSHPDVIRMLANAGKRLREARPGPRPAPTTARNPDPAERRYGRMRD